MNITTYNMNYKIRFHLAKGVNFMKWQIKDTKSGEVIYISPKDYSLHFEGVTLKNSKSTANKIKQGSNKTVCAWLLVDTYSVSRTYKVSALGDELRYNPRVAPHWVLNGDDVDGSYINSITTVNNKLYLN